MKISENYLDQLKCCECDCYLSVSPIMIKEDGENVCGRCYMELEKNDELVKNYVYEALASNMLFPCRYKENGCKENLPWNRAQFHEEGCEFQIYECPSAPIGKCEWKGFRSELLAHFKNLHSNCVLDNPCLMKPDIKQSSEHNFLISTHGFLFILQTKCSVSAAKLCYCVRFLGYVNLASLFDFTVDMKTTSDELKKTKVVANQENITFEKDNFIEISINSLLGNLGDYKDIAFTLNINKISNKFKLMECFYCDAFINSYEIKENNCCKNCTISNEVITSCKNKHLDCSYSDIPINIRKHEKWLCDKENDCKTKCILCRLDKNKCNDILSNHLKHGIMTLIQINTVYTTFNNFFNIIYDNTVFACFWTMENNVLIFKIISDIPKTKNKMYTCTLKLYNPSTYYSIKKNLYFDIKSLNYDWVVKIKNNYENPFIHRQIKNVERYAELNNILEMYGVELEIRRNDKYTNLWFLYEFPNLSRHTFKESPILSWKNIFVVICISSFINFAFSGNVGPLFVFNRPVVADEPGIFRKMFIN